jgi:ribonucleoside-diphosphate reductase beta chain
MKILNTNKVDYTQEPLFFGEPLGLQTYNTPKYPALQTLNKKMKSMYWLPEEIPLSKDRNDWMKLSDVSKDIFIKNLSYQILLDSVQGRGPVSVILPIISNPELEACVVTWDFFETIHSESYTYIIKNLFHDPKVIFDEILNIKEILERASSITKYYDELAKVSYLFKAGKKADDNDKKTLLKALVAINILEGIRFYVSFACAFAMGELNLMEGNAKIIRLIARDEALHLSLIQHLINILRTREGYQDLFQECLPDIVQIFHDAVEEEKRWANFLFRDGTMIGLNAEMLHSYIEWISNRRSGAIGLEKLFKDAPTENPLPWTDNWLGSKNVQNAPQEVSIDSYTVSALNVEIDEEFYKTLKI